MKWLLLIIGMVLSLLFPTNSLAQTTPKQSFSKGKVIKILKDGKKEIGGTQNNYQQLLIRITSGPEKGKEIIIDYGGIVMLPESKKVAKDMTVILTRTEQKEKQATYSVIDTYRMTSLFLFIGAFVIIVIALTGIKGIGSLLGMGFSLFVIMYFIVPQILSGSDPLVISIIGSFIILLVTLYLAHGFTHQTTIALGATTISLLLTGIISVVFVKLAFLSGLGTEDAYSLQQGFSQTINFQGLLLGGIIIGSLGVLDDVTTTQSATITELQKTNPQISFSSLVQKGMRVGREHITSVVNTLVLAYAGASIGLFIFLSLALQEQVQPLWVMVNSEAIAEEVIRTLAGSIGIILAVPITTLLASFFAKYSVKIS